MKCPVVIKTNQSEACPAATNPRRTKLTVDRDSPDTFLPPSFPFLLRTPWSPLKMLQNLPLEIFYLIARYIIGQEDRYNLIRTCRRFYQLLVGSYYGSLLFCNPRAGSLQCLARTFYQKPALGRTVMFFTISDWNSGRIYRYRGLAKEIEDVKLLKSIREAPKVAKLIPDADGYREPWMRSTLLYNEDACVALLLPMMNNLRVLNVGNLCSAHHVREMIHKASIGAPPFHLQQPFPFLHTVSVEATTSSEGFSGRTVEVKEILPFFKFPAMRCFSAHSATDRDMPDEEIQRGFSTVTDLTLTKFESYRGLHDVITACRGLKSLRFSQHTWRAPTPFDPDSIWPALYATRKTLENLCLEYQKNRIHFREYACMRGSFVHFPVLKNLHICGEHLLNMDHIKKPNGRDGEAVYNHTPKFPLIDILPPSLETLHIWFIYDYHLQCLAGQLLDLLHQRQLFVPRLRKLTVQKVDERFDGENLKYQQAREMVNEIRLVCGIAGIEFEDYDIEPSEEEPRQRVREESSSSEEEEVIDGIITITRVSRRTRLIR